MALPVGWPLRKCNPGNGSELTRLVAARILQRFF
jgi:hypothetical protein